MIFKSSLYLINLNFSRTLADDINAKSSRFFFLFLNIFLNGIFIAVNEAPTIRVKFYAPRSSFIRQTLSFDRPLLIIYIASLVPDYIYLDFRSLILVFVGVIS